jgi:hypothetical protein
MGLQYPELRIGRTLSLFPIRRLPSWRRNMGIGRGIR